MVDAREKKLLNESVTVKMPAIQFYVQRQRASTREEVISAIDMALVRPPNVFMAKYGMSP